MGKKISKDIKDTGKVVFDGPSVKKRKNFAPATKKETPKKGKGSYDRKVVDESQHISSFVQCVMDSEHSKAFDHLKKAVTSKIQARISDEIDKPIF